jgi:hypothetical protein
MFAHFPHYCENFSGASSMFAHFPHCYANFYGASSNLAHFLHCDENFGDMSSKIGGPPPPPPICSKVSIYAYVCMYCTVLVHSTRSRSREVEGRGGVDYQS